MSLKNILLDISSILGLNIDDSAELAYHIAKINEAADELYRSNDIPGCLREQLFEVNDTETYQIAFPSQVDKIRAIRFYNTNGGQITLEDMRPRYHQHRWGSNGRLKFRIKQQTALLSRGIDNAALFTFTLKKAEAANIVINIVGKTEFASRQTETLTILAGESSATTVNSYEDFISIEKTVLNNYDIVITDVDGNTMGTIYNYELRPRYTIIQIREDDYAPVTNNSYPLNIIECLYKTAFIPFRNNYDEYPCRDCDKLITWKFIEHYAIYKGTDEMQGLAVNAATKVEQILAELNKNDSEGLQLMIEWAKNPMFSAQRTFPESDLYFSAPSPLIEYLQ